MKTSSFGLAALLPILAVVACSSTAAEHTGASSEAIMNGSVDAFDAPVGFVALNVPGFDWCTGTLITPDVVLTAAHCIVDDNVSASQVQFLIGQGTSLPTPLSYAPGGFTASFNVDAIAVDPSYVSALADFDVALLHLSSPVPTTTPAYFAPGAPSVGKEGRGVGYGWFSTVQTATNLGPANAGQRREALMTVSAIAANSFTVAPGSGGDSGNATKGDSGGPLFDDEGSIYGVVSREIVAKAGVANPLVHNETYARLDVASAWIDKTIAGWIQSSLGSPLKVQISNGYMTLASGASNDALANVEAGVNWANPANVTIKVDPTSLPSGISVTYTQTIGYIWPVEGPAGGLTVTVSPGTPVGTQATLRLIVSDGVTTVVPTAEIVVNDLACAPNACDNSCGIVANGCSGTMSCSCSAGSVCEKNSCVATGEPTCKAPLHNCGGYCARICT